MALAGLTLQSPLVDVLPLDTWDPMSGLTLYFGVLVAIYDRMRHVPVVLMSSPCSSSTRNEGFSQKSWLRMNPVL
jgi:hypothetical protein